MNAVQKLEAAIEKLERLKAEVQLGTLAVTRFKDGRNEDVWIDSDYTHDTGARTLRTAVVFDRSQGHHRFSTAEYIVTLHRTIDAQLAILRAASADYLGWYGPAGYEDGDGDPEPYFQSALALASAILGES